MENKKKRSPIMVIGFVIMIGFLVIALLKGISAQLAWGPQKAGS